MGFLSDALRTDHSTASFRLFFCHVLTVIRVAMRGTHTRIGLWNKINIMIVLLNFSLIIFACFPARKKKRDKKGIYTSEYLFKKPMVNFIENTKMSMR